MAKNLRNLFLASTMAVTAMLAGCGHSNNNDDFDQEEKPKKEVVSDAKIREKQKQIYRERVYDSVKTATGAKAIDEELHSKRSRYADEEDINNLMHPFTLGGFMEHKVSSAGIKIIDDSYQQIIDVLAKYGVSLDNYISQGSANFYLKPRLMSGDEVLSKYGMCFVDVAKRISPDIYDDAEEAWDDLVSMINLAISEAKCSNGEPYGDNQQNNMKNAVNDIVKQAKKGLVQNYTSVEKQYADYYLVQDPKYLGTSYWCEGDYGYGYADLNGWANSKYLVTVRKIDVYDSNLDVNFFGDKDAKYELLVAGEYEFRVLRKYGNGQSDTTNVFQDKRDFHEERVPMDEPVQIGTTDFDFEPGGNMGVRVFYEQIVSIEKRKKDWNTVIPDDVQSKIDSLANEKEKKEQLYNNYLNLLHHADSVANFMVAQKFLELQAER